MAATTIDQEFIEFIVKTLVSNPDAVRIERTIDERGVLLELYVDPGDLGRVIGRNGTTAKSIRILLRALGVKNDARYNLKIVDTNGGGRRDRDDYPSQQSDVEPDQEKDHAEAVAEAKSEEPIEEPALSEESDAEDDTEVLGEEGEDKSEEERKKKLREGLEDLDLDI